METSPVKSPVTYKRRRSGRPLSELLWNGSDVDVDPESAVSLASDAEGIENVTPAKKNRKRWSDQPLPRRQTRSSTTPGGESTALKDRGVGSVGKLFGKKGKEKENEKGKVVERSRSKGKENVEGKGIERTPGKDTEKDEGNGVERTPTKDTEKDKGKGGERTLRKDTEKDKGKGIERTPRKDTEKEKGKGVERTPTKDTENDKGKGIKRTPRKDTEKDKGKGVERTPTPSKRTARKHASKESPAGDGPGSWHSPIEFVMEKRAMFAEIDAFELESEEEEPEEMKTTGIEMQSNSSGETISLDSTKGETSVEPPNMRPEQSTQDATSTEELSKGETAVQPPNTRPDQSTQDVITEEAGSSSRGERAVQTPNTRLEQSTEQVTITAEVGEKDDG